MIRFARTAAIAKSGQAKRVSSPVGEEEASLEREIFVPCILQGNFCTSQVARELAGVRRLASQRPTRTGQRLEWGGHRCFP